MKLYQNLDVTVKYQNFGSAWLLILRGRTEDVELVFNGLYNLCATDGSIEYPEQTKTIGKVWTSEENLRRFFTNRFDFANPDYADAIANNNCPEKDNYVNTQIEELRLNHEFFLKFSEGYMPDTYGQGTIGAEKPDDDFRDAIINDAFKDKPDVKEKDLEIV